MDLNPATFVRLDLFPSLVMDMADPDEPILISKEARVIVTNDTFYIFEEGTSGPTIKYSEYLSEFEGSNKTGWVITTADEKIFHVSRAPNCGCGSTLRAFFPFPGVPYISHVKG